MKIKLAVAGTVMIAAGLLAVLMTVWPEKTPAPKPEPERRPAAAPLPPAPGPAEPRELVADQPAVADASSPLPSEEELSAIEERLENSFDRLPVMDRLKLRLFTPGPKMDGDEYEKARGLFLRFLDNFSRIPTARFRVEQYHVLKDGSERLAREEEIIWSPSAYRFECTTHQPGKEPSTDLWVCDGRRASLWRDGHEQTNTRLARGHRAVGNYLFEQEMRVIRDARPYLLNLWTDCAVVDGAVGYSRLSNDQGSEMRFDSESGLMTYIAHTEETRTYRYQKVDGFWFLQEEVRTFDKPTDWEVEQGVTGMRLVFSQVELNEPLNMAEFNVDNPF